MKIKTRLCFPHSTSNACNQMIKYSPKLLETFNDFCEPVDEILECDRSDEGF